MKNKPFNLREGAKGKNHKHSSERWKKIKNAIDEASDNGRLWWIEQYLRNKIK